MSVSYELMMSYPDTTSTALSESQSFCCRSLNLLRTPGWRKHRALWARRRRPRRAGDRNRKRHISVGPGLKFIAWFSAAHTYALDKMGNLLGSCPFRVVGVFPQVSVM